ncbi:hypothetical protein B6V75_13140 [Thioclava sp. F1Mire-8]|uniref:PAS-domain containing protein n=1 Tax=Thioclava sp. F1Mire-8 TaxID=1973006 RepID=UPI000B54141A|nr:PAS-domain containing protein [Thioclava sp. F1Mire-8]OWY02810.1 hypothetical protein B6V75_13140 [Thioclava sp. F1Mire-8]
MRTAWLEAAMIALTSVGAALVGLLLTWIAVGRGPRRKLTPAAREDVEEVALLFDDEALVDATPPARRLLETMPVGVTDWARFTAFAAPRFPEFQSRIARLSEFARLEMTETATRGDKPRLRLTAENLRGLARITLIDPEGEGQGQRVDNLSLRAMEDELEMMRATLDRSPVLIWRIEKNGELTWANRAYLLRAGAFDADEEGFGWPLPKLFTLPPDAFSGGGPHRLELTSPAPGASDVATWFDCHSVVLEGGTLHFALPAEAAVRAEQALRDFVQTLTKTFADLPTGLAIFDRDRQLRLFNPALSDLLQLGPEFLATRPTLYAFLDRLRETKMVPEPKDYRSWRQEMTELERAAASGFHAETWNLPGGQTYRVTGRPHPDGAVAFLFEDISSEASLTRQFRGEIEMSQEILDRIGDAIAVFRPSGELAISNAAYGALWGVDPEASLGRVTLLDAVKQWQACAEPSAFWSWLQNLAREIGARENLTEEITLLDGRRVTCRLETLSGGAFLLRFAVVETSDTPPPRKAEAIIAQ